MSFIANTIQEKKCVSCLKTFDCGDTKKKGCWCNEYPAIFSLSENKGCLCPNCLHEATKIKIDEYTLQMQQSKCKNNIAAQLPTQNHLLPEIDYYIDHGLWVFTAWHHLKRGSCCQNGCRHCPYGFKKKKP